MVKKIIEKLKQIWKDRNITIICGETVFKNIDYNIFDCAKSVEYQYAPSKDAFDSYETILEKAKTIDKNRLVLIILGPTATVLAYDLAKSGYQALDIGHVAKDFNAYVYKVENVEQNIVAFFAPD